MPAANAAPAGKVFVCKFVGKPGGEGYERLQTGQNPISVSVNAVVGSKFKDAQELSVVIAPDYGQPKPSIDICIAILEGEQGGDL